MLIQVNSNLNIGIYFSENDRANQLFYFSVVGSVPRERLVEKLKSFENTKSTTNLLQNRLFEHDQNLSTELRWSEDLLIFRKKLILKFKDIINANINYFI